MSKRDFCWWKFIPGFCKVLKITSAICLHLSISNEPRNSQIYSITLKFNCAHVEQIRSYFNGNLNFSLFQMIQTYSFCLQFTIQFNTLFNFVHNSTWYTLFFIQFILYRIAYTIQSCTKSTFSTQFNSI